MCVTSEKTMESHAHNGVTEFDWESEFFENANGGSVLRVDQRA